MTIDRAFNLLKLAALFLCIVGGLILALGAHPATALPANFFIDLCFWPLDGAERISTPEARLLAGIGGGGFVGLGCAIWAIAERSPARDRVGAKAILVGMVGWFLTDSTFSVVAGAPMNALYNVGLLLAFLVPLLAIKKEQLRFTSS